MSPFGPALTSTHNSLIKRARQLGTRKARYQERAFLVESTRLLQDAVAAGYLPDSVLFDATRLSEPIVQLISQIAQAHTIVHSVPSNLIESMAHTETPQGLIAIFRFPEVPIDLGIAEPLFIVADGIKDPGNLGTLLRTATAAGVHAVFLTPTTVDPYAPKVIRAGMGAHFRLPLRPLDWTSPDPLLESCAQWLAADASGPSPYDTVDWRRSTVLVLGSEATGISDWAESRVTGRVSIPMQRGVESLNAAVSGAVILFEAVRQRQTQ